MRFHKLEECLRQPWSAALLGVGEGSADFAQLVKESQKFYVGDVSLFDRVLTPTEIPRLPYPLCIFEFCNVLPGDVRASFFVLAEELGYSKPELDCVRAVVFIPYISSDERHESWLQIGWTEADRRTGMCDDFLNKRVRDVCAGFKGHKAIAEANTLADFLRAAVEWLFLFLSVLNCANVSIKEIGAPEHLNRKRANKGKLPLYSYKTLVLKTREQRVLVNGHGHHESPRIHLRRGHIKRRKTGNFWWQPHVVGDRSRGIVAKDYRADHLLPA